MNIEFSTISEVQARRFLENSCYSSLTSEQKELIIANLSYGVRVQDPMMYGQSAGITINPCFQYEFHCGTCDTNSTFKTYENIGCLDFPFCQNCGKEIPTLVQKTELKEFTEGLKKKIFTTDLIRVTSFLAHSKYDYFSQAQKTTILKFISSIHVIDPDLVESPTIRIQGDFAKFIYHEVCFADRDDAGRFSAFQILNNASSAIYSVEKEIREFVESKKLTGTFSSFLKKNFNFFMSCNANNLLQSMIKLANKRELVHIDNNYKFPTISRYSTNIKNEGNFLEIISFIKANKLISKYHSSYEVIEDYDNADSAVWTFSLTSDLNYALSKYTTKHEKSLKDFNYILSKLKKIAEIQASIEELQMQYETFVINNI